MNKILFLGISLLIIGLMSLVSYGQEPTNFDNINNLRENNINQYSPVIPLGYDDNRSLNKKRSLGEKRPLLNNLIKICLSSYIQTPTCKKILDNLNNKEEKRIACGNGKVCCKFGFFVGCRKPSKDCVPC